jgi:chromosome segregation ATPase
MNKNKFLAVGLSVFIFIVLIVNSGYCLSLDEMFGGKAKEYKELLDQKDKENQSLSEENKKLQSLLDEAQKQNESIKRDYQSIEIDRNNLLEQTKILLKEKHGLVEAKDNFDKINEQNQELVSAKEKADKEKSMLSDNLDVLKVHLKDLTQQKIRLEGLLEESRSDQSSKIGKMTTKLQARVKELESLSSSLKKDKITLTNELRQMDNDVKILEKSKVTLEDKIESLRKQLDELEINYVSIQKENKYLIEESREFPKRFADLARQNKRLIEETSDMHYNLGVFYVNNNEHQQAVKEFIKVLELKPDHAYANYNLGYIYAEYLVDREKAIDYFKTYLTYAPDAKDVDWVKKYILTWQTWYGKEKIK